MSYQGMTAKELLNTLNRDGKLSQEHRLATHKEGHSIAQQTQDGRWVAIAGQTIDGNWYRLESEILVNGKNPIAQDAWEPFAPEPMV